MPEGVPMYGLVLGVDGAISAGRGVLMVARTAGCAAAVTAIEAAAISMTAWPPNDAAMAQRFARRAVPAVMSYL
jgi:hypothetical protein